MAAVLDRHPGMTLKEVGDLDPYQVRYVLLRPPPDKADGPPPGLGGPEATSAAYRDYFKKLGMSDADAAARTADLVKGG